MADNNNNNNTEMDEESAQKGDDFDLEKQGWDRGDYQGWGAPQSEASRRPLQHEAPASLGVEVGARSVFPTGCDTVDGAEPLPSKEGRKEKSPEETGSAKSPVSGRPEFKNQVRRTVHPPDPPGGEPESQSSSSSSSSTSSSGGSSQHKPPPPPPPTTTTTTTTADRPMQEEDVPAATRCTRDPAGLVYSPLPPTTYRQRQQEDLIPAAHQSSPIDPTLLLPNFKDQVRSQHQPATTGKRSVPSAEGVAGQKASTEPITVPPTPVPQMADQHQGRRSQQPQINAKNTVGAWPGEDLKREQQQQQQQQQPGLGASSGSEGVAVPDAVLVESRNEEIPMASLVPVRRTKIIFVLIILGVAAVVFLGAFCGAGNCSRSTPSNPAPNDRGPTQPPLNNSTQSPSDNNQSRSDDIVSYINNTTLSGSAIAYPVEGLSATSSELALQWLIEEDPLQLTTETAEGRFRLQQRYALATSYFHLQGGFWTDSTGWLENPNECEWFRIQCSSELLNDVGRQSVVSKIVFSEEDSSSGKYLGNNLHGRLPEDIALLTFLTVLDLNNNTIGGTIPDTIGQLSSVTTLNLGDNELSGTIPASIGSLSRLDTFWVDENKLTGTLPEQIGQWSNLTGFFVEGKNLRGPLPTSIGNWDRLVVFKAHDNRFESGLPNSIGQWTNLKWFFVYNNDLNGTFPESMSNCRNLEAMIAGGNNFVGTLPDSIGKWSSIVGFDVGQNELRGQLPESIGNWSNIRQAEFHWNSFTGTIPESICNWSNIQLFYFYWNELKGPLPSCICNITSSPRLAADCTEVGCSCCLYCSEEF